MSRLHCRWRPASAALAASLALATIAAPRAPASAHGSSSIEGTVTNAAGEPLADVCVVASRVDVAGEAYAGATDAAGFFDIRVRGGDYVVAYNRCEQRRTGFAPEYFDDATDIDQATTVRVEEETTLAGIDAMLAPTGSFSGVVIDEANGEGVKGICVVAESATDIWTQRATTGAQGEYRVDDLPAGEYVVLFEDCSDPLTYVSERYDDATVRNGATPSRSPPSVPSSSRGSRRARTTWRTTRRNPAAPTPLPPAGTTTSRHARPPSRWSCARVTPSTRSTRSCSRCRAPASSAPRTTTRTASPTSRAATSTAR